MIKCFILHHPSSKMILDIESFKRINILDCKTISCGMSNVGGVDYSEVKDFNPSYASWNSALFETSVILTIWEHSDKLLQEDYISFLHTDLEPRFNVEYIWADIHLALSENIDTTIGLTIPSSYKNYEDKWESDRLDMKFKNDCYHSNNFDLNTDVWKLIKKYDNDIYDWAIDTNPLMIYTHQFACHRHIFEKVGARLYKTALKMRLADVGIWTPHVFERLLALYLAKFGTPRLNASFYHFASSSISGPGDNSLYGLRSYKYYKLPR